MSALLAGRANVVLTRVGDTNRSLTGRAGVAKAANADVFVSIHMNGWRDPALDGTEAWVAKGADARSRALARSVLDRVVAVTHASDRGVCEADLGVLLPARQGLHTAAALVELAFHTNPAEAERLTHDDYRQALAQAIADGIVDRLPAARVQAAAAALSSYARAPFGTEARLDEAGGRLRAPAVRHRRARPVRRRPVREPALRRAVARCRVLLRRADRA